MSAGFVGQGFGASTLRGLTKSNAPIDLYVDPVAGNDFNLGTIGSPVKTLDFVDAVLPDDIRYPVNVHLKAANYVLPASGTFLSSRILNSTLRLFGDPVWDPSVDQVIHAEAAQAGTTDAVIKQTGLVANTLIGRTCEVTVGGIKQRKTIKGNTATDVLVCEKFNPAPNPGDPVRITQTRAIFVTPAAAVAVDTYQFARHQAVAGQDPTAGQYGSLAPTPQPGIILENVAFDCSVNAGYGGVSFAEGLFYLYGVDGRRSNPGGSQPTLFFNLSQAFAGLGLNGRDADRGYGSSCVNIGQQSPAIFTSGSFTGYYAGESAVPAAINGGEIILWSGFAHFMLLTENRSATVFGNADSTIPFTIQNVGSGCVNMVPNPANGAVGTCQANFSFAVDIDANGGVGPIVVVQNGAICNIDANVTGASAGAVSVLVSAGGRVYVSPTPALGGATLWKTPNTAGVAAAALVAGFALIDPVDASAIIVAAP